jgi:AcrR family transcriptional regulator
VEHVGEQKNSPKPAADLPGVPATQQSVKQLLPCDRIVTTGYNITTGYYKIEVIRMTIADRKEREKRLRRQAILKSAKKIIARSGVEEMSMNRLAEATELNKATLYLYFSSKDDLVDAIVYEGLLILEEDLKKADSQFEIGLEKVMSHVNTIFVFYREHPVYFHTFNHQERRRASLRIETPYAEEGNELASRIFERTGAALKLGMDQGNIRKDVNINGFLVLMFAHIYGVMHTIYSKEDVYEDVLSLDAATIQESAIELLRHHLEVKK